MFLSEYVKRMMQKQNLTLNNHPQRFDPCIMKLLQRRDGALSGTTGFDRNAVDYR